MDNIILRSVAITMCPSEDKKRCSRRTLKELEDADPERFVRDTNPLSP